MVTKEKEVDNVKSVTHFLVILDINSLYPKITIPWWSILTGAHGVAPARDFAHGASGGTAGGQSHGLHGGVEGGGLAQLDQHDVVVDVVGAVVGVTDDAGRADELLVTLVHSDVVLPKTNLHTTEREREMHKKDSMFFPKIF